MFNDKNIYLIRGLYILWAIILVSIYISPLIGGRGRFNMLTLFFILLGIVYILVAIKNPYSSRGFTSLILSFSTQIIIWFLTSVDLSEAYLPHEMALIGLGIGLYIFSLALAILAVLKNES